MRFADLRWLAILTAGVFLGASGTIHEIPFDRASAGSIKTIGIITPILTDGPISMTISGGDDSLIGGIFGSMGLQTSQSELEESVKSQNFQADTFLIKELQEVLEARGYATKLIPVQHDHDDFLKKYPSDEQVDAFLDVRPTHSAGYGYMADTERFPYHPFVWLNVRLVRASDADVLMQDAISYNPMNALSNGILITETYHDDSEIYDEQVSIPADGRYRFSNADDIGRDPARAVEGLKESIQQTALAVGRLLQ